MVQSRARGTTVSFNVLYIRQFWSTVENGNIERIPCVVRLGRSVMSNIRDQLSICFTVLAIRGVLKL